MSQTTINPPALPAYDFTPAPYDGPSKEEVLATRKQFVNPAIFHYYQDPIMVVQGNMQYLFDETGRRYLDMFGGIVTVSCGHCHPKITKAVADQLQKIQHTTTIYLHPNFGNYAKALIEKMPDGLDVVYFTNSGSEANDLAMLMARLSTGNHDIIALQNGYHGGSQATMGLTSHPTWKYPLPHGNGVHHVPNPDPYRSPYTGTPEELAHKSAEAVRRTIEYSTPGNLAAFIAEPIQGVGGATAGAPNYLGEVYDIVRENGGVCISDEVQTGFGRTGEHFWGFQNYNVTPDIVTMAKGIGNGFALGAVVTSRKIAEFLAQRIHFNTYGGNPLSMAAGRAVLEVIEEDGLQKNSAEMGARFNAGLLALQQKHELIGDVRGKGLMIGLELVKDRTTKEPATQECAAVFEECKNKGLIIGKGGLYGNTLRIKPPMCINAADVDFALEVLDQTIAGAR